MWNDCFRDYYYYLSLSLQLMIKNILIRRKESDTYLANVSRHRWSTQIRMKNDEILQLSTSLHQLKSSLVFLFYQISPSSSAVCRHDLRRYDSFLLYLAIFLFLYDVSLLENNHMTINKSIVIIKNILKRREESNTYLTHVCRHRQSRQITMKMDESSSFIVICLLR